MRACRRGAHVRPMRRFASYTVRVGLVVAWFLAASPMRRSVSVNATQEGVMRLPWSFAMISTRPFLYTPTQLYVVPRSMPITVPSDSSCAATPANAAAARRPACTRARWRTRWAAAWAA